MAKRPNDKVLPPVRPNAGISAWYRAQLDALIAEMENSVRYHVRAAYRTNEPVIAQDELPAAALERAIKKLRRRWQRKFDLAAPQLAKYFTQKVEKRSKDQLQKILKDAGLSVAFTMTKGQQDGIRANVIENVSLIRSIPQQYFTQVEGAVMRSVQAGRDLQQLHDAVLPQLTHMGKRAKKRAALIARDQNNKATAFLTRTRQTEMGITEAIWLHSHGGKVPRPTHLANNGERYDVKTGWYDPDANGKGNGAHIFPGELINCRCVSRSIIPGFT